MHLRQRAKSDRENGISIENLRPARTVGSAGHHHGDSTFMISVVCAVVKQLMELRRGREGNDNQQVSREQAGECVLPRSCVSKPLHFHPFKALYRPSQNDCCENNPPLFNEGVRKGLLRRRRGLTIFVRMAGVLLVFSYLIVPAVCGINLARGCCLAGSLRR
jgi:hypothetical protein